ncbi:MAG: LPS export ABC transporter periplasmic protein LptC [Spirochaetaceae bacterium]|jgi:hypothetical protein|nr:LPS export ABC transporter periplasmic protein LptC [Spirochaetaceae bacterium]
MNYSAAELTGRKIDTDINIFLNNLRKTSDKKGMRFILIISSLFAALISCTFNYGDTVEESLDFPEITMENLEYVRVKDGSISAKLIAEIAEKYETKHTMNISNYEFQQYKPVSAEVEAAGNGGDASIDTANNNVKMSKGVNIRVDSEDFNLETVSLEWQDKQKILQGGKGDSVHISRKDGTDINGADFYADIMSRTWVFGTNVSGVYVNESSEQNQTPDTHDAENVPENGAAPKPESAGVENEKTIP